MRRVIRLCYTMGMRTSEIETGSRVRYVGHAVLTCDKGAEGIMLGSFESKRGPAYRVEFPHGVETLFAAEFEVVAPVKPAPLAFGSMVRLVAPGVERVARDCTLGMVVPADTRGVVVSPNSDGVPMVEVHWERAGTTYQYPHELEVI